MSGPAEAGAAQAGPTPHSPPNSPGFRALVGRLGGAQKSAVGVPAYMRYVNRPAGGRLAVLAFMIGLTPTAVTLLSAALSFVGIALLALVDPTPAGSVAVAACLVVGFALDSADGQLARLRGGGSLSGEWLDHVVDCVKSSTLHAAVAVSLYRFGSLHSAWPLLLPLGFGVAGMAQYFGMMLRDQLFRAEAPTPRPAGPATVLRAVVLLPVDYGVLCLAFALLWATHAFLWVYGALGVVTAAFAVYSLSKAYRQLAAVDRSRP